MPNFSRYARQGRNIRLSNEAARDLQNIQTEINNQVKEITDKLKSLPAEYHSKAIKKALRPAANMLRDSAKQNAPTDGTNPYTANGVQLRESIKTFSLRKSKKALFVGPKMPRSVRTGRVKYGYPYYAHWVEFGTKNMVGKGYMRRAYDQNKGRAVIMIRENVKKIQRRWEQKNKV